MLARGATDRQPATRLFRFSERLRERDRIGAERAPATLDKCWSGYVSSSDCGPARRIRAEPDDRRPARGNLRLALGRGEPSRVPATRLGLLLGGSFGRGPLPGQRIRATLPYPGEGGTFEAKGYLAVDEGERRMDWGAQAGRDYSGWLTVANHTEGASELVLHLSFGERCAGSEMREQAPERQSAPWRRHNGDAWEHPAAERGGFGQGGGPAACGGGRAAAGGEPSRGRRGLPARFSAGVKPSEALFTRVRGRGVLRSPKRRGPGS